MLIREISVSKLAKELGKTQNWLRKFEEAIFKVLLDTLLEAEKGMAERSPVDTGLYANSWETKADNAAFTAFFGNSSPYAGFLEHGARPFRAPYKPLAEWAGRKLQKPPDDPEVRAFAWAIIKKFEREGMKPKYILTEGLDEYIKPLFKKKLDQFAKREGAG